jgi:hypothetical protein
MFRRWTLALAAALVSSLSAQAGEVKGIYVEARNCDVWTGPCFANADFNLTGKNAVLAWKIEEGEFENVNLQGLGVVAVVSANNTLGLDQTGPAKAVVLLDKKANSQQREALLRFAQKQGGKLLANVVRVQDVPIDIAQCECKGQTCAEVNATVARIKTRCLDDNHDKACGNESAFFPPLTENVKAKVAGVVEHVFSGAGLNLTYSDYDRRGGYVGSFEAR